MAKAKKSSKKVSSGSAPADPTKLEPFPDTDGKSSPEDEPVQVIIETPKGSRNKYAWDEEQKLFVLKGSLPAGMVFPYDFGFVPQTRAGDGDALDVLVLMDEPAFTGCALKVRLIGVIEGEQIQPGKPPVRNDRLVGVAAAAHMYSNLTRLKDIPEKSLEEIQEFFVNYHKLQGKKYKLLGCHGRKKAHDLIEQTRERR